VRDEVHGDAARNQPKATKRHSGQSLRRSAEFEVGFPGPVAQFQPPLTTMEMPQQKVAMSLARNKSALPTSSMDPLLPSHCNGARCA